MNKKFSEKTGLFLAIVGLALAAVGIYNGEVSAVFEKSIRICLECIGIGRK